MLASSFFFFFFNDTATTEIYTLSLHDALPISCTPNSRAPARRRRSSPGVSSLPHVDRKSTRLNSSHVEISYAVFCLKKKKKNKNEIGGKKENVAPSTCSTSVRLVVYG